MNFIAQDFELQSIYPNPFSNHLAVELNSKTNQELYIRLMDTNRKLVWNKRLAVQAVVSIINLEIDAKVASGVYLIEVFSKHLAKSKRLIKF